LDRPGYNDERKSAAHRFGFQRDVDLPSETRKSAARSIGGGSMPIFTDLPARPMAQLYPDHFRAPLFNLRQHPRLRPVQYESKISREWLVTSGAISDFGRREIPRAIGTWHMEEQENE